MNNEQTSINKVDIDTQNAPEKGPLSFLTGSLTSFLLCIFSYFISNKIAIYFHSTNHQTHLKLFKVYLLVLIH